MGRRYNPSTEELRDIKRHQRSGWNLNMSQFGYQYKPPKPRSYKPRKTDSVAQPASGATGCKTDTVALRKKHRRKKSRKSRKQSEHQQDQSRV